MSEKGHSSRIPDLLARLRAGDPEAMNELLALASVRFLAFCQEMLRRSPKVGRWEEDDDLLQEALLRLTRALEATSPETKEDFDRLAFTQIRRQLLDLVRKYKGARGLATKHETHNPARGPGPVEMAADRGVDSVRIAMWEEFLEQVEMLPNELLEVVNMVHFGGLSHPEAAERLGIPISELKKRWRRARIVLHDAMDDNLPDL